jgi:hypothetical protein
MGHQFLPPASRAARICSRTLWMKPTSSAASRMSVLMSFVRTLVVPGGRPARLSPFWNLFLGLGLAMPLQEAVAVGKDVAKPAGDLVIASPASTGRAAQGAGGGVEGLQHGFETFTIFAHRRSNASRRRRSQTKTRPGIGAARRERTTCRAALARPRGTEAAPAYLWPFQRCRSRKTGGSSGDAPPMPERRAAEGRIMQ